MTVALRPRDFPVKNKRPNRALGSRFAAWNGRERPHWKDIPHPFFFFFTRRETTKERQLQRPVKRRKGKFLNIGRRES